MLLTVELLFLLADKCLEDHESLRVHVSILTHGVRQEDRPAGFAERGTLRIDPMGAACPRVYTGEDGRVTHSVPEVSARPYRAVAPSTLSAMPLPQ